MFFCEQSSFCVKEVKSFHRRSGGGGGGYRKCHLELVLSINTVENFLFFDYFFVKQFPLPQTFEQLEQILYKGIFRNLHIIDALYL